MLLPLPAAKAADQQRSYVFTSIKRLTNIYAQKLFTSKEATTQTTAATAYHRHSMRVGRVQVKQHWLDSQVPACHDLNTFASYNTNVRGNNSAASGAPATPGLKHTSYT